MGYLHPQRLFGRNYNFMYAGIAKFQYLCVIDIDEVVVLLEFERFFELGAVITELMLGNQVAT
jgi:hypothetical protein